MTQVKVTVIYTVELDPANAEHYFYEKSRVIPGLSENDLLEAMAKEDIDAVNQGMCLINEIAVDEIEIVDVQVVEDA